MESARRVLSFVVAGALLGITGASLIGPRYLAWDNTAAGGQALCDCAKVAADTASRLLHYQLIGSGTGIVLGLIAGVAFVVLRRKKPTPA